MVFNVSVNTADNTLRNFISRAPIWATPYAMPRAQSAEVTYLALRPRQTIKGFVFARHG